jgi:MerR family transcriptional regulator/heat shock protein HspR
MAMEVHTVVGIILVFINTGMNKHDAISPAYPIGFVAEKLGISVETIRLYERQGLILVTKSEGRQRLFSDSDIERLKCIRHAINEEKISIAGIRHMLALIPCWDIVGCSKTHRQRCKAFVEHSQPCWSFDHLKNPCASLECKECAVYRMSNDCSTIKKSISEITRS